MMKHRMKVFSLGVVCWTLFSAPESALAQACKTQGDPPHQVCLPLGVRCNGGSGICCTVIQPFNRSTCECLSVSKCPGLSIALVPLDGSLPDATGAAFLDDEDGGVREAAVATEGLAPDTTYQAFLHVSGSCTDGEGVQIGGDFVTDGSGVGGVLGQTSGTGAVTVWEPGANDPVLCGVGSAVSTDVRTWGTVKIRY